MSNVIRLPTARPRPAPDSTLRADCERLMRKLAETRCAFEFEMRDLADLLDIIVTRTERNT